MAEKLFKEVPIMEKEKNSILIIDDENTNLKVLCNILGQNYTVYTARGGIKALKLADQYIPDLILLDILMPDINGFEVLKGLKNSEKTSHIPVIIITGLNSTEDEERSLNLGAADFIPKPFSNKIVKSRVMNQLQIINQDRDLKAALESAENANRSKSSFLARMSHEIRTPLNAVLGIAEIQLQNETIQPDAKEAYTRIFNSGNLLLGIINDILDMSKIEAGKLELIQDIYDLASLINDTVYLNMIKYENEPVKFILNVDENVPSQLFGDELRIKQILNNLLSNSFKYTNEGEVELSLNAEYVSNDTVTLIFRVRDTGQGMTPDQIEKLFDEYSRFNMEANRTTIGTGLGMSITQNLVKMMNGEILVESEYGKGSLFTVRLPQGNTGAVPIGKETAEKLKQFQLIYITELEKKHIVRKPIPFGKVLVVDDLDMNLYVIKGMLSPYGLQIDTAVSGHEAIEKIKKNTYDLVFMDHMMPVMDGVEAVRRIREWEAEENQRKKSKLSEAQLPIIALTANAVSGMREMFLANGFDGFISKPIIMQELDDLLKKWLSPEKISQYKEPETVDADETYDSFMEEIVKIGDINTEIGLKLAAGNKSTYSSTLKIFYEKLVLICNEMTAFLEDKKLKEFEVSVHSMKTMLAIIGAANLSETALILERASEKDDIDFCMRMFGEFKGKLLSLHEKLSAIFQVSENPENERKSGSKDLAPAGGKTFTGKILLVDDTKMVLYVIKEKLLTYGLQVDTAESGPEAIDKIKNNEYDLVFMDHKMPKMNGIEATREIRKWEHEKYQQKTGLTEAEVSTVKGLPIIALTAVDSGIEEKFLTAGLNGFLSKPVESEKLEEVFRKWL